jgi:hypothetical protein
VAAGIPVCHDCIYVVHRGMGSRRGTGAPP